MREQQGVPGYLGIHQCSLYGLSLQPDNGVAVTYQLVITNINADLISLNVISTAGHHRRRAELTISGIRLLAQDPLQLVISVILPGPIGPSAWAFACR